MTAILTGFLANPTIIAIFAAIIGALGYGFQQRLAGAKAERNKLAAKERDSYAKHLQDIADAANARPSGKLSDDPNNRD
ncbi:ABC transporter permease [Mesorhizobium sp. A556]